MVIVAPSSVVPVRPGGSARTHRFDTSSAQPSIRPTAGRRLWGRVRGYVPGAVTVANQLEPVRGSPEPGAGFDDRVAEPAVRLEPMMSAAEWGEVAVAGRAALVVRHSMVLVAPPSRAGAPGEDAAREPELGADAHPGRRLVGVGSRAHSGRSPGVRRRSSLHQSSSVGEQRRPSRPKNSRLPNASVHRCSNRSVRSVGRVERPARAGSADPQRAGPAFVVTRGSAPAMLLGQLAATRHRVIEGRGRRCAQRDRRRRCGRWSSSTVTCRASSASNRSSSTWSACRVSQASSSIRSRVTTPGAPRSERRARRRSRRRRQDGRRRGRRPGARNASIVPLHHAQCRGGGAAGSARRESVVRPSPSTGPARCPRSGPRPRRSGMPRQCRLLEVSARRVEGSAAPRVAAPVIHRSPPINRDLAWDGRDRPG